MAKRKFVVSDYEGRSTFNFILNQVNECINDINPFFVNLDVEDVYASNYLEKARAYFNERTSISVIDMAMYDIAYLVVYYGTAFLDMNGLLRLLRRYYNEELLQKIAIYITLKPHRDSDQYQYWEFIRNKHDDVVNTIKNKLTLSIAIDTSVEKLLNERPFKYYGGHQYKLGHYYRHLFQSVKYVNEQKILSYKEKYEYIKTLRAQISSPEQYLLFFNSICCLGRAWELNHVNEKCYNNYLITKYNLIKNIPDFYLFNKINIRDFYPLVNFEITEKPIERIEVERYFK